MCFLTDAGSEEQRLRVSPLVPVAERQGPKVGNGDWSAVVVGELPQESAACWRIGVDMAVAVVAYEQSAAEAAEIRRRQRQSPGGVEGPLRGETAKEHSIGVVNVDETKPGAGRFFSLVIRALLCIGDE